ncbi:hypothetical protein GGR56DRAFT_672314 [Xylariaceae sp. FL0804]|nr:hypothetical protein GGR56DRAFT_672314 [Xylariaceae sp. FL0804]
MRFEIAVTSNPCYICVKRLDKAIGLYKRVYRYPGGSTRDAHRLNRVVRALCSGTNFEGDGDITSHETPARVGVGAGLGPAGKSKFGGARTGEATASMRRPGKR